MLCAQSFYGCAFLWLYRWSGEAWICLSVVNVGAIAFFYICVGDDRTPLDGSESLCVAWGTLKLVTLSSSSFFYLSLSLSLLTQKTRCGEELVVVVVTLLVGVPKVFVGDDACLVRCAKDCGE